MFQSQGVRIRQSGADRLFVSAGRQAQAVVVAKCSRIWGPLDESD